MVSELLKILWDSFLATANVILLTVMELCHVTVAQILASGLAKDIMPFDLM